MIELYTAKSGIEPFSPTPIWSDRSHPAVLRVESWTPICRRTWYKTWGLVPGLGVRTFRVEVIFHAEDELFPLSGLKGSSCTDVGLCPYLKSLELSASHWKRERPELKSLELSASHWKHERPELKSLELSTWTVVSTHWKHE